MTRLLTFVIPPLTFPHLSPPLLSLPPSPSPSPQRPHRPDHSWSYASVQIWRSSQLDDPCKPWFTSTEYMMSIMANKDDFELTLVASSLIPRPQLQLQYGIATESWVGPGNEARLLSKGNPAYCMHLNLVSSPDLIRHMFTSSITRGKWKWSVLGLVLGLGPRLI